jgi:hypothetical protein
MSDGTQYDLSSAVKDPDFLKADVRDKIAFLSAHDSDFANANLKDKMGYIDHILGQGEPEDTRGTYEKLTAPIDTGAQSPATRLLSSVGGAVMGAPAAIWNQAQSIAQNPTKMLLGPAGALIPENANLSDYGKAATWKAIPSVLPEALGAGIGGYAAGEITGAAGSKLRMPTAQIGKLKGAIGDTIVDPSGNPKLLPRLVLGKDRSEVLGQALKPEIAERQGAQVIRAAKDEMYNDLAQRAMTRGVEQQQLDNMFSDRLKAIEDARQKELASWERLRNQNAESLMRRAKEQSGLDKAADLFEKGKQEFLAKKAGFPKPLNPLIATPEEFAAYQQQMRILEQQARDAGMYHAAQGSARKTTNLQQRIGKKLTDF